MRRTLNKLAVGGSDRKCIESGIECIRFAEVLASCVDDVDVLVTAQLLPGVCKSLPLSMFALSFERTFT